MHSPVLYLLGDLAIIIVAARLLGRLARKLGQPSVVGEILAGVLLGPTLFSGAITKALFPMDLRPMLQSLSIVGLVLFMFVVGYEVDRSLIRGRERVAVRVSIGSIILPLGLGAALGVWLAHRHDVDDVLPFALFIGASMSVTAFPVLARILTDRGLQRTRIGGLAIASAAVDDVLAWSLLAVVVTIAGSEGGSDQWHVLLSPVYIALMALVVRPLLQRLVTARNRAGRLTPDVLAIIVVGLVLSCYATEWLGVHYIFGAFIFGACMPRLHGEQLREDVLERLEQISVIVLLPVFFVIAGLGVNLSQVGLAGLLELVAILVVAIGGKFIGAYLGARSAGVPSRQSAVLGTLMNTRGLTEIVILTVGKELGILDTELFSLMVVMALVTTIMAGPLLKVFYPKRLVERDLADAERAALGNAVAYRVVAVVDDPVLDVDVVQTAVAIAAGRRPSQVLITRFVAHAATARLEVGSGLGSELLVMTKALQELHELAARVRVPGVEVTVFSQFSDDPAADLARHVATAEADVVVARAGSAPVAAVTAVRVVEVVATPPADPP
ncbi:cation:proton antiporter, partial [Jatrophihabitans sp. YIM 134969]